MMLNIAGEQKQVNKSFWESQLSTGRSDTDGRGIEWLNKGEGGRDPNRTRDAPLRFCRGWENGCGQKERKQWTSDSLVDDVVFSRHRRSREWATSLDEKLVGRRGAC